MTQGLYTIGVAGTLVTLVMLTSYAEGVTLHMTHIVHNATMLILLIGGLQQHPICSRLHRVPHICGCNVLNLFTMLFNLWSCMPCLFSVLQQFAGLYAFVQHFHDTDFLYVKDTVYEVDFHGSFYCGIAGLICCTVSELILLLSDDIILPTRNAPSDWDYEKLRRMYRPSPPVYKVHVL